MKKIKVGDFESQELDKYQEFQIGHFLDEVEKFELVK